MVSSGTDSHSQIVMKGKSDENYYLKDKGDAEEASLIGIEQDHDRAPEKNYVTRYDYYIQPNNYNESDKLRPRSSASAHYQALAYQTRNGQAFQYDQSYGGRSETSHGRRLVRSQSRSISFRSEISYDWRREDSRNDHRQNSRRAHQKHGQNAASFSSHVSTDPAIISHRESNGERNARLLLPVRNSWAQEVGYETHSGRFSGFSGEVSKDVVVLASSIPVDVLNNGMLDHHSFNEDFAQLPPPMFEDFNRNGNVPSNAVQVLPHPRVSALLDIPKQDREVIPENRQETKRPISRNSTTVKSYNYPYPAVKNQSTAQASVVPDDPTSFLFNKPTRTSSKSVVRLTTLPPEKGETDESLKKRVENFLNGNSEEALSIFRGNAGRYWMVEWARRESQKKSNRDKVKKKNSFIARNSSVKSNDSTGSHGSLFGRLFSRFKSAPKSEERMQENVVVACIYKVEVLDDDASDSHSYADRRFSNYSNSTMSSFRSSRPKNTILGNSETRIRSSKSSMSHNELNQPRVRRDSSSSETSEISYTSDMLSGTGPGYQYNRASSAHLQQKFQRISSEAGADSGVSVDKPPPKMSRSYGRPY